MSSMPEHLRSLISESFVCIQIQRMVDEGIEDVRKGKVISNQDAIVKIRSFSQSRY
jgi:hypothetical protein